MSAAAAASAAAVGPSSRKSQTPPRSFHPTSRDLIKIPPCSSPSPSFRFQPQRATASPRSSIRWRTMVFVSGEGGSSGAPDELSLDAFLSVAEVLCVAPPAVYSIACLVSLVIPGGAKLFRVNLGSRVCALHFFLLVAAVLIGGMIRRRQWGKICGANAAGGSGFDLIGRIEKVEEDVRCSATVVRVLSRKLEKLGIRFRVTRKALKDPVAETAALAQKNSEATRELAMQEDILEKELGEIQKVLLAMQDQQQKQLELILAVGKAGKLFERKQDSVVVTDIKNSAASNNSVPQKGEEAKPLEIRTRKHAGASNE